jgi:N-methylhydantoinase A/oxoprolinase/acetone carboxylase beta subunit
LNVKQVKLKSDRESQTALVLGIDTGGTYTDGVLLDYYSHRVLASHKSLTTKRDFSIGIEAVIQGIRIEDPAAIQMVSVSTTLATNAIAEGKSKQVALLLIGYDPDLITSFNMQGRFATPHYFYFAGGHNLYGQEKEPLDLPAILAKVSQIKGDVDALAVSAYFSPLNPEHELRVFKAISGVCDLPVVLGHQLSTKLGSVERATTAALNASLLSVLKEFIIAVRRAMEHRRIKAPLMVVRGDGTLMSDEFAARTPVETIHSGPAASAIGGRFLSELDQALVVDIGGTTTDIALVENGQVAVSEEGAVVSSYKTAVKAANLFSIALGGDSHITPDTENSIRIGPQRVTPLAYLAEQFPRIESDLKAISQRSDAHLTPDLLEYWYLLRAPAEADWLKTDQEKNLVEFLSRGPRPLPDILSHLKLFSKVQISTDNLMRREIIGIAGLTPTDLLHIEGRYSAWHVQAATVAQNIFCRCKRLDPAEFREQIWFQMTETIIHAIVTFLSGKTLSLASHGRATDMGQWFFYNSIRNEHPHLETRFRLRLPIIGIGAPAAIFLETVAEKLNCRLILPSHHEVANAVGAVAGSVMVAEDVLVYPRMASDGLEVVGYTVQTGECREAFDEADQALAYARNLGRERALGAALRSGADNPEVIIKEVNDGLDTYRIRAKAVGKPRLMRMSPKVA